jgi:YegS/Rv2252/BmrU family lipid kinase
MNMSAGSSSRHRADLLQETAQRLGHTLDLALPQTPDETTAAVRHAVASGYERVLCAGGDGTLNLVASALLDTDCPLAIIPTGTANLLARELNIPLDPEQALRVAFAGPVRYLDVGMANGQPFLLMAGLGFDAQVVSEIVPHFKDYFGPLAYITAGLQVLARYKPSQFHLEVGGNQLVLPAWLVVVGNASHYGYELSLSPTARMDDGLLDVCIFAEHSAFDRLSQIGAVFAGLHEKHPNVRSFQTSHLTITAEPRVQLQLDGDLVGQSPVEIGMRASALPVVVPPTPC